MKKNLLWMLAAILTLCGSMALTSCSDKNDAETPDNPLAPEMPQITEEYEGMVTWVAAGVQRCHPYINQFWNQDADPADFNLLLLNEAKTKLYMINADGKREIPQSEWDDELMRGMDEVENAGYYFLTFQERRCCLQIFTPQIWKMRKEMLNAITSTTATVQDMGYDVLLTFYHESFHNYIQDLRGWEKSESEFYSRDQSYPIDYEPRTCRKLALLALLKAWRDPAQKADQYARAKYWIEKYKHDFSTEAQGIRETDIVEGTAEFFGRSIVHAAFPDFELLHGIEGYELGSSVDDESYQFSLALQLIRRDEQLNEAMQAFKEGRYTPIDFLLKDVSIPASYDESQDADDRATIRKELDKQYSEANPYMAPVAQTLKLHDAGQAVYLAVKNDQLDGYTTSQGNYSLTNYPGFTFTVKLTSIYSNVECMEANVLIWENYCCFPVNPDHLVITDWQDIEDVSEIPDVTFTRQGTLTAVNDEETFRVLQLPATLKYGKDNLGNEFYVCPLTN